MLRELEAVDGARQPSPLLKGVHRFRRHSGTWFRHESCVFHTGIRRAQVFTAGHDSWICSGGRSSSPCGDDFLHSALFLHRAFWERRALNDAEYRSRSNESSWILRPRAFTEYGTQATTASTSRFQAVCAASCVGMFTSFVSSFIPVLFRGVRKQKRGAKGGDFDADLFLSVPSTTTCRWLVTGGPTILSFAPLL